MTTRSIPARSRRVSAWTKPRRAARPSTAPPCPAPTSTIRRSAWREQRDGGRQDRRDRRRARRRRRRAPGADRSRAPRAEGHRCRRSGCRAGSTRSGRTALRRPRPSSRRELLRARRGRMPRDWRARPRPPRARRRRRARARAGHSVSSAQRMRAGADAEVEDAQADRAAARRVSAARPRPCVSVSGRGSSTSGEIDERQAPELAPPGDLGQRLSGRAARGELGEPRRGRFPSGSRARRSATAG